MTMEGTCYPYSTVVNTALLYSCRGMYPTCLIPQHVHFNSMKHNTELTHSSHLHVPAYIIAFHGVAYIGRTQLHNWVSLFMLFLLMRLHGLKFNSGGVASFPGHIRIFGRGREIQQSQWCTEGLHSRGCFSPNPAFECSWWFFFTFVYYKVAWVTVSYWFQRWKIQYVCAWYMQARECKGCT